MERGRNLNMLRGALDLRGWFANASSRSNFGTFEIRGNETDEGGSTGLGNCKHTCANNLSQRQGNIIHITIKTASNNITIFSFSAPAYSAGYQRLCPATSIFVRRLHLCKCHLRNLSYRMCFSIPFHPQCKQSRSSNEARRISKCS
jgi:hypothetical protein